MAQKLRDHTVMPPDETEPLTQMVAALKEGQAAALVGPDDRRWELPDEAYRVLREVLLAMANGLAITVMPRQTMLTTQEAADVLGISRPTLVRLLEGGEIPYEQRGRHRRVLLVDVLAYQERARVDRDKHLDALVGEGAALGLYRDAASPRPTR